MCQAYKKFDLCGKSALVTGGAEGLGYHMTKALVQSGARVMIAARREHLLREAAEKIMRESSAGEVLYHQVDLADRGSVAALAKHAISTLNGVDIFVPNAVMSVLEPIEDISSSALDGQFEVNVCSTFELIRAFLPAMRQKKWGRVIIISSVLSEYAAPGNGVTAYGLTKSALNALARYVAVEGGRDGITANSLVLGLYRSLKEEAAMVQFGERAKKIAAAWGSMFPAGRMGEIDEVEGIIQLLASNAGSYISGACIPVDGGLTALLVPYIT